MDTASYDIEMTGAAGVGSVIPAADTVNLQRALP